MKLTGKKETFRKYLIFTGKQAGKHGLWNGITFFSELSATFKELKPAKKGKNSFRRLNLTDSTTLCTDSVNLYITDR